MFVSTLAAVALLLLAGPVSAHHRPGHGPKPTPSPSPSPSVSPSMPIATRTPVPFNPATYTTAGRHILDPNGARVVIRGIEQAYWDASWLPTTLVDQIGETGANMVRILPYYTKPTPTAEPNNTIAQIETMIQKGIAGDMMVDVAIDKGEILSTYGLTEVKTLLQAYSSRITVIAHYESYEASGTAWRDQAISDVQQMRTWGYTMPLYVFPRDGGRHLPDVLTYGQAVVDADPLHRIIFGWEAYWGTSNFYQNQYGMTLTQALDAVAVANFPVQIGLLKFSEGSEPPDNMETIPYSNLMAQAQRLGLNWTWWDWRMGRDNFTNDPGRYPEDLTALGTEVVQTDPNGIVNTSVRTPYMTGG